jgi:hypothetical protein
LASGKTPLNWNKTMDNEKRDGMIEKKWNNGIVQECEDGKR